MGRHARADCHQPSRKHCWRNGPSASGLWLHCSGLLGGSPDGIVDENTIIEVKCPYSARSTSLLMLADSPKSFLKRVDPSREELCLYLKDDTGLRYFHQIQGNLCLAGRRACDLVVWKPSQTVIIRIEKRKDWEANFDLLLTDFILCQFFLSYSHPSDLIYLL